jgi:lipopolysaccharide biosynthesis glycosyltransferase
MRPRLIAMGFDDNYLFPALVTLFSARSSYSGEIRVLIAHDGVSLTKESLILVEQVCGFLDIELSFKQLSLPKYLSGAGHLSAISWARILLISQLNEEFVWLDSDLLLFPGWDALIRQDYFQEGMGVAAALDTNTAPVSQNNAAYESAGNRYINSGVLVLSPDLLKQDFKKGLVDSIVLYKDLGFQWLDQDVLNHNLEGRLYLLPQHLNQQVIPYRLGKVSGTVLHFYTDAKPWLGPSRIAGFWSYSVRIWNRSARDLLKKTAGNTHLRKSLKTLYKKTSRSESLNWGSKPAPQRMVLAIARLIWS